MATRKCLDKGKHKANPEPDIGTITAQIEEDGLVTCIQLQRGQALLMYVPHFISCGCH